MKVESIFHITNFKDVKILGVNNQFYNKIYRNQETLYKISSPPTHAHLRMPAKAFVSVYIQYM